jgi:hypothetical protein
MFGFDDFLDALRSPSAIGFVMFVVLLGVCYRVTLQAYLRFKRRKEGYGTVFNSYTGEPVDLARIRLVDPHGMTAVTAVTDRYGHYRLIVSPGEYVVDVTRNGFTFPSIFLNRTERSVTYDNIIPSRQIRIKDHGIMTKNIPVDPVSPTRRRSRVFRRWFVLSENTQLLIAWLSPVAALLFPLIVPLALPAKISTWVAALLYTGAMGRRFITFKPGRGAYGTVTDARSGTPLDRVIIRLFDAKYNKHLQTLTTSNKGRYAFLVNAGSYYLLMKKDGYTTVRLNFPNIPNDTYPLATDVRMKRILETAGGNGVSEESTNKSVGP